MMSFLFGLIVGFVLAVVGLAIWGALWVSGQTDDREIVELRRVE